MDLGDLPLDVRGAMERGMQVEAVIGLQDINPSFTAAALAAAQTVRVIVTPLGIAGTVAEKMLLPAGSKAESYDAMLLDFAQQWRSGWSFDDIGEQGYRSQFPDPAESVLVASGQQHAHGAGRHAGAQCLRAVGRAEYGGRRANPLDRDVGNCAPHDNKLLNNAEYVRGRGAVGVRGDACAHGRRRLGNIGQARSPSEASPNRGAR